MATTNKTEPIYEFESLPSGLAAAAGGKAATLARLSQRGFAIPAGFVILPGAFTDGGLTDTAWTRVQSEAAQLAGGTFAVRSSAPGEDGANASFAGEFDSVLNVAAGATLREAIEEVYASGQNDRAAAYAAMHRRAMPEAIAVIVQEMVPAEWAGVLFTADPVNSDQNVMTGNFVTGLGERLVAGEANAAAFWLRRPGGHYKGPASLRPYARRLFKLGTRLESELGGPQDIEWAIAGGKVAPLQARPITTMQAYDAVTGEWNDSRRGRYLWSNANFGEAIPGVMTPLTWSLIRIYGEETLGNPFPGNHPFMGNIGGRFYVNLSLFASLMQAIGVGRERMKAESELFFGNLPTDFPIPRIQFSRWKLLRRFLPYALRTMRRRRQNLARLGSFTAAVPAKIAAIKQQIDAAEKPVVLAEIWLNELEPLLRLTYQMLQAGTSQYENRYRPLHKSLVAQIGAADANLLLSGVSETAHGDGAGDWLASLKPLLGLWQVQRGELSREAYLDQYGHRGDHEMELAWVRPSENPSWLDQQLAALVGVDVPARLAQRTAEKTAAWERYVQSYGNRTGRIQKKLASAAAAARGRETIRSEVTRLIFLVRQFSLKAGALTGLGDDVFYLWLEELLPTLQGQTADLSPIPIRRAAHERLAALPSYPALILGRFVPEKWAVDPARRTDLFAPDLGPPPAPDRVIRGFPGSAGVVEGLVRRLDDPSQGHLLQPGEILVATTTNIGWTPLFPRAGAIVTDVGAPLSHAAIVARELGLPAVVGTGTATMALQTGDRVRVNGSQGTVDLL